MFDNLKEQAAIVGAVLAIVGLLALQIALYAAPIVVGVWLAREWGIL